MLNDVIVSNNYRYKLNVSIYSIEDGGVCQNLVTENIGLFEYTNQMNVLVNHGTLEYTDTDSIIDKFLLKQYVYCKADFFKLDQTVDGSIVVETEDNKESVNIEFFVDNIIIEKNEPGKIKYKLILLSNNNFEVKRDFEYSNYGTGKENIIDIIKKAMTNTKLNVDVDSFTKIKSNVALKYITSGNDNVESCIRYLFNKLYFQKKYGIDESLKAIVYDEFKHVYHLFDMNTTNKYQNVFSVEINMIKETQDISYDNQVNIAFIVIKSKSDVIQSTIKTIIYDYNLETNEFSDPDEVSSKSIRNYFKGNSTDTKMQPIYDDVYYHRKQSAWNNNIDFYGEQFSNLVNNQSMVVNVGGRIGIIPGWFTAINVTIKDGQIQSQSSSAYSEAKQKYQSIAGSWLVSKVTNFINPQKNIFRQNISLVRTDHTT